MIVPPCVCDPALRGVCRPCSRIKRRTCSFETGMPRCRARSTLCGSFRPGTPGPLPRSVPRGSGPPAPRPSMPAYGPGVEPGCRLPRIVRGTGQAPQPTHTCRAMCISSSSFPIIGSPTSCLVRLSFCPRAGPPPERRLGATRLSLRSGRKITSCHSHSTIKRVSKIFEGKQSASMAALLFLQRATAIRCEEHLALNADRPSGS